MKHKFQCPGCKRREIINIDKIKLNKHVPREKFDEIIADMRNYLGKNLYTKEEGAGISINANMRELFAKLTDKYGIDEIITIVFTGYVSAITRHLIRKDTPLELVDKMEENKGE